MLAAAPAKVSVTAKTMLVISFMGSSDVRPLTDDALYNESRYGGHLVFSLQDSSDRALKLLNRRFARCGRLAPSLPTSSIVRSSTTVRMGRRLHRPEGLGREFRGYSHWPCAAFVLQI